MSLCPGACGPLLRTGLLLLATLLAACASNPKSGGKTPQRAPPVYEPLDGPPSTPFDVDQLPEPQVRNEPRSRYGNTSPYEVLGKRYTVLPSAEGYVERGTASWYGTKFHGRLTSNREPYDMFAFTAAHKSLPLPSYVRVTNLRNGKSVVVRVNDRGPFVGDRLIDLSYAAAVKLGVHLTGTTPVEIRALSVDGEPESHLAAANPPASGSYLQVAAFAEKKNASALARRLRATGLKPVKVVRTRARGKRIYRVRIGPIHSEAELANMDRRLAELGLSGVLRVHRSD